MPSLYPENLLLQLEHQRIGGAFKPENFDNYVSSNIFLSWKDLQSYQLQELASTKAVQQKRHYLSKCLLLEDRYPVDEGSDVERSQAEARREIFLDVALQTLTFCKRVKFTPVKTSAMFSIVNTVHIAACELPGPPMPIEKAYGLIEDLLLRHGVERPPFSTAIFTHTDVQAASQHLVSTYLRHLKQYQYVFGSWNALSLSATSRTASSVDVSLIKPLSAAITTTPLPDEAKAVITEGDAERVSEGDVEGSTDDAAEPGAVEQEAEDATTPPPDLESILTSPEEKEVFEKALGKELAKLQKEMTAKMAEQQAAFAKRLEILEGGGQSRPSSSKKK